MGTRGHSNAKVCGLWVATAALLSAAAILGKLLLAEMSETLLAAIRCIAAGAVIASVATEVFPKAFRQDHHWTGIATALGAILSFALGSAAG